MSAETLVQARDRMYAEEMAAKRAARAARDKAYEEMRQKDFIRVVKEAPRQSTMPRTQVAEADVKPARRTAYSKDPRICKHQFGGQGTDAFCRYCATTNPAVRFSFHDLG